MSFFPQVGAGAISQFPIHRTRRWRSILNEMESGERIQLADTAANEIQWKLSLKDLSDTESAAITNLFNSLQGQFGAFLFVDPLANLLGWSEDFSKPDWQLGLLTASAGASDPLEGTRASLLTNSSAGPQSAQQSLTIPGDYVACFSAWVYATAASQVTLTRDGNSQAITAGPMWKRGYLSRPGVSGSAQSTFSLSLSAGASVKVWGMQVEAQPFPSEYKQTQTAHGIYEETYFGNDQLTMTSTGVGLSSCDITLVSRG